MFSEETGDYPILLITLSHSSLSEPIRVSSDPTSRISSTDADIVYGTVSRGNTFVFMPFTMSLPGDTEDSAPKTTISIDNVTRELVPTIRALTSPPTVTMELVMASTPDFVEALLPGFDLTSISYDALTISGTLSVELLISEPFPAGTFTPSQFPGLF